MKHIIVALVIVLMASASHELYSKDMFKEHQNQDKNISISLHYENTDEYGGDEYGNGCTDEYDETICDGTKPPKISIIQSIIANILGSIFIQLLVIKEKTHMCMAEIKEFIAHYYAMMMRSRT